MEAVTSDTVLSVEDISVDIGSAKILQHVSFSTCNGDVLAVMGPTGSGKTTLLNAIAGHQPLSAGHIFLSGKQFNKRLRRKLGFVIQQDVFFSNLTLWETLYFTAMVRLPESLQQSEKLKKIESIIDLMQLGKCKNTAIGDIFHKGLSGGEKKRASIANTLLTDPDILLLDEPTSGLDSSIAEEIVSQLKILASENKTVIVTIHQPSSEIYHMFDGLLLLAQGQVVYKGGAHREPLDFLERSGYICDQLFNPADFIMKVLRLDDKKLSELVQSRKCLEEEGTNRNGLESVDQEGIGRRLGNNLGHVAIFQLLMVEEDPRSPSEHYSVYEWTHGWNNQPFRNQLDNLTKVIDLLKNSSMSLITITTEDSDVNVSDRERWPTGFATQFRMLTWRSFKQSRRTFLFIHNVVLFLILGVFAGVLMSDNVKSFRDVMGMVFYIVVLWAYGASQQAAAIFPAEIEVISRERASGTYRLSAFYLSKMASELPLTLTTPTLFYSAIFWIARIGDVREFFITWPVFLLDVVSIQGLGLFISVIVPDRRLSFAVLHGVLHFALLFCGFVVQYIPYWLVWAKYFSHMHYPISAVCIILYDNKEPVSCNLTNVAHFPKCLQNSSDFITSTDILHDAGIDLPLHCYIGTMALVCVILRVSVYLALRLKRHRIN